MKKEEKWILEILLLAVCGLCVALAFNPMFTFVLFGIIGPVTVGLLTVYLLFSGQLKGRMKPWAVIACGMLLMSSAES